MGLLTSSPGDAEKPVIPDSALHTCMETILVLKRDVAKYMTRNFVLSDMKPQKGC